jgi:tRNA dimethylallyltransferase
MPSPADSGRPPDVVFLIGPTAAGKSALALELARRIPGEIVSADSRLLYRGMDIGTAKPTPASRALVPHHLIDVTDPDQPWTLAQFQCAALAWFTEIRRRGRIPFCVGGTGQYVRSLLEGWRIPPAPPDRSLRERLERRIQDGETASLHTELARLDPDAAAAIDPRNLRRVVRALEVVLATGNKFSSQRTRGAINFTPILLGLTLPRMILYGRVDDLSSMMPMLMMLMMLGMVMPMMQGMSGEEEGEEEVETAKPAAPKAETGLPTSEGV